jgi:hypothetical protein
MLIARDHLKERSAANPSATSLAARENQAAAPLGAAHFLAKD